MTLDPVLLEKQVARERRKSRRNIGLLFGYYWVACTLVSYVFAALLRVPLPLRYGVAAAGGVIGSTVILLGVSAVQTLSQRGLLAVLEPGGRGREKAVFSHAEALAVQGNLEAAGKAFDQARAEHGERASLLRAEAEVQLRQDGNPERARELLMRLRRSSDASRADELYATHRLVDLYLGPLQDDARAMAELRRLAERFPGTRDAEGALAELQRRRALMKDQHEHP
jgi:tetratricopeptide (TPR) repeat protein